MYDFIYLLILVFWPVAFVFAAITAYKFVKRFVTRNRPAFPQKNLKKPDSAFKTSRRLLIIAIVLWGIGLAGVLRYGGSEGLIATIPIFFSAFVMTIIAGVAFIIDISGR